MKNAFPLISLIIPAHNAADFIEECLHSVVNQTYQNLEIIIIDDDSSDQTKEIIQRYKAKDSRLNYHFVKKHNAAQARRKGIELAHAELVCFADADDILHEEYVSALYGALKETGTSIATGKIKSFNTELSLQNIQEESGKTTVERNLLAYLGDNYHAKSNTRYIAQSINAKLFTKNLFEKIDYSVLKSSVLEDNYIIAQVLQGVRPQEIAMVDKTIYYYRLNQNSTMGTVLNHLISYGKKDVSYPWLFQKTMEYIQDLYNGTTDAKYYTYKIMSEEYYGLAEVVVDRNIHLAEREELIVSLKEHIRVIEGELEILNTKTQDLVNSRSYKVGRLLTAPVRIFKR